MNVRNVTSKAPSRRTYSSPLREKQAEATRQLIIEGLLEQLAEGGLRELSIPQVAKRAGVTTRTVYRYFPTREALLDAVDSEMEARIGSLFDVRSIDGIFEQVKPQFAMFTRHGTLVRALLQAGVGGEIRLRGRRRRTARLRAVLAEELPSLSADEIRRAAALVHYVFSASAWDTLQRVWGLTDEEAADIVAWGVRTLVEKLRCDAAARGGGRPRRKTGKSST